MLPVASRCRNVLKHIPKTTEYVATKTTCSSQRYTVNIDTPSSCPVSPLFCYNILSSSILSHQRLNNKPISNMIHRSSHTMVMSTRDSIDLQTQLEACERVALRPAEVLHSIRVGDGVTAPLTLFCGSQPQHVTVYLSVFDLMENTEHQNICISSYSKTSFQPYRSQGDGGAASFPDTIINYAFRTRDQDNMMCCLSLEHEDGSPLGRCYLSLDHSNALVSLEPVIKLPVINETDIIVGTLVCSILEVAGLDASGLNTPAPPVLETRPLEIGHRGCGVTHTDRELFTSIPCLPENTIASLTMAFVHGADMVETDVAVTQDQKAVIHHDLEIQITREDTVPISHVTSNILGNLPLPQLQMTGQEASEQLLTDLRCGQRNMQMVAENLNEYPALSEILAKLPEQLGIMLEVKSSVPEVGVEAVPYHQDKNTSVDTILKDLLLHAGERHIVLCSFCPTTCIMLRNKQTRWPVVLIIQGSTDTYADYTDHRLRSFQSSINLALSENLHGLSIFSGLLQEDAQSKLHALKEAGLATFVWGYHNCDKKFRDLMRSYCVNGVIYDRIYEEDLAKRVLETEDITRLEVSS